MTALMFLGFLKGPIGMTMIGASVAVSAAVGGVVAGPSAARAVMARVNATPAPTFEPSLTGAVGASPSPKPRTSTSGGRQE